MADIRPFMSIRPEKGKAAKIAALPYDVYNREEATKEVERHPQSFLSIDRAETQFPLSVDMYDDKVYERAHDTLWQWVEDGTFLTEDKKCYYLYELTMNGRVQTGVAACASIDDYENGVIKKHENIMCLGYSYWYLAGIILLLCFLYICFMKKYFGLHQST